MKKIVVIFCMYVMACFVGQAQTVTLTFTGLDSNGRYCQLDSVSIVNMTKGWQEIIRWPDTVLTMQEGTGIDESVANGVFALSQNTPNPFTGTTDVNLTVADAGVVTLELVDGNGKIVGTCHGTSLQRGTHQFRISPATAGIYVLTARQNGKTSSIKMVCNGGGNGNAIEYSGNVGTCHGASLHCVTSKSNSRGITTKPFNVGDIMEYVGYATIDGVVAESQRITQEQDSSQIFTLQFEMVREMNPCPGTPTVMDIDTNIYRTVQIGSQCWMAENLRTTRYASGISISEGSTHDYGSVCWYYPNHHASNKALYGLLYSWKAVMGTSSSSNAVPSGVQGICPDGWHVPSFAEWDTLMAYIGREPSYWCGQNNENIAKALSSRAYWEPCDCDEDCAVGNHLYANNATCFNALPAGYLGSTYYAFGYWTFFWSATRCGDSDAYSYAWFYDDVYVARNYDPNYCGFSVRCIKDE